MQVVEQLVSIGGRLMVIEHDAGSSSYGNILLGEDGNMHSEPKQNT
jgi:hypothetical protein